MRDNDEGEWGEDELGTDGHGSNGALRGRNVLPWGGTEGTADAHARIASRSSKALI